MLNSSRDTWPDLETNVYLSVKASSNHCTRDCSLCSHHDGNFFSVALRQCNFYQTTQTTLHNFPHSSAMIGKPHYSFFACKPHPQNTAHAKHTHKPLPHRRVIFSSSRDDICTSVLQNSLQIWPY